MGTGDPLIDSLLGDPLESGDAGAVAPAVLAVGAAGATNRSVAHDGSDEIRRLTDWRAAIQSADQEIIPEKDILDARTRDRLRNDAYVAGAGRQRKDSIVGAQYVLNSKPETKILWGSDDPVWEKEFQEEVETKFNLVADSPMHYFDAQQVNTLTGLVRLAVGVDLAGGEVLASAEWDRRGGRMYRTMVQMIDTDRLTTPWDRMNDRNIRKGVEKGFYGQPLAYHIRSEHPSDFQPTFITSPGLYKWRRVPARKPWGRQMILHMYETLRPDQTRGISAMSSALTELRMMQRFRQTELERAVIAATYAASIETELPSGDVYAAMGGDEGSTDPSMIWTTNYMDSVANYSGGAKNMHINGARIPVFWPGTRLKIQNPGAASPAGDKFEASLLRHVAAALDLSYEQLSRDYTQTNYASARASMSETFRAMQARKKMVADRFATFVYRLWLEEAVNYGHLETLKRPNVPNFYEGINADAYSACAWIGAGTGFIDPLKETQADVLAISNGLMTKEEAISRRTGGDFRKVARQRKRELEMDQVLGLPSIHEGEGNNQDMMNALTGEPRERGADDGQGNSNET